jgi:hypothetical protein
MINSTVPNCSTCLFLTSGFDKPGQFFDMSGFDTAAATDNADTAIDPALRCGTVAGG